ncbi:MAG: enoyl-CoA hydratase, partial [Actinomycetia bacterium]|nr:enoyl-CoA hydratase [Actinomycetes bacterium]
MADEVLTEVEGKVLKITLNRPDAMNAVNLELAEAMAAAMEELDNNSALSVGVLTGAGRGFSAGMDLKAFVSGGMPNVADRGFAGITEKAADKPLIAAVEGFALAG